ncbi:hypothetical protein IP69_16700 [Bosea sp. AAP35]|nr:hypothetical protein IP69_16700 [Bosea sp. AAP35]
MLIVLPCMAGGIGPSGTGRLTQGRLCLREASTSGAVETSSHAPMSSFKVAPAPRPAMEAE